MKRVKIVVAIFVGIGIVLALVKGLCLIVLPGVNDVRDSYGQFTIGQSQADVMSIVEQDDRYALIGVLEQSNSETVRREWTRSSVAGEPTEKLSEQRFKDNSFLADLGWTYPTISIPGGLIVIVDVRLNYIYLYLDSNNEVMAIYIGAS